MAWILYLLLVLLIALPVFAIGVFPSAPGMTLGSQNGMQMSFTTKTIPNSKPPKQTIGLTLKYPEFEAKPAAADEIPALLADLGSDDQETSGKAAARLSISGDQAVNPLVQILTGEEKLRSRVATVLACIGMKDAYKALRALPVEPFMADIENDDAAISMPAALVLAIIGDKAVVDKLVARLHSNDENGIQIPIMIGLALNTSVKTLPFIEACLTDEKSDMRAFAVFVVGMSGGKQAYDRVVPLLGDSDQAVRMFTVMALSVIDDKRAIPILSHILLFGESPEARAFTLAQLGKTKDASLIPLLTCALQKEQEPGVRTFIVFALGQMPKTPECLAALMFACKDEDENVRKVAESMLKEKTEKK